MARSVVDNPELGTAVGAALTVAPGVGIAVALLADVAGAGENVIALLGLLLGPAIAGWRARRADLDAGLVLGLMALAFVIACVGMAIFGFFAFLDDMEGA